jgi:PAS domain S-box-containing protein
MVVPVFRSDRIVAVLGVANKSTDYTEEDIRTVSSLADLAWEMASRKQTERALRESEQKFNKAFQASAHVITITRIRDGSFVDMNEAFTEHCGYTREEALASSTVGLDLWVDLKARDRLLKGLRKHGSVLGEECRFRTKDGRILTALYSAHTIQLGGETCVLANLNDITARKQAEESLRDLLEERTALLKEVHHRVKNNLQIVSSLLNLQAARTTQGDQLNALHETGSRVRAMALLHETLYRSGSLARVDLHAYLERVCAQLARASDPEVMGRVKLQLDVEAFELSLDQAVPAGLLIHELVSNALKHAFPDNQSGTIRLSLRTASHSPGSRTVEIEVVNDGRPLPDDFDTAKCETLGLQLVTALLSQLHGSMEVHRTPQTGFYIAFETQSP